MCDVEVEIAAIFFDTDRPFWAIPKSSRVSYVGDLFSRFAKCLSTTPYLNYKDYKEVVYCLYVYLWSVLRPHHFRFNGRKEISNYTFVYASRYKHIYICIPSRIQSNFKLYEQTHIGRNKLHNRLLTKTMLLCLSLLHSSSSTPVVNLRGKASTIVNYDSNLSNFLVCTTVES